MSTLLNTLLEAFVEKEGTDLYLTVGSQPQMRQEDEQMIHLSDTVLEDDHLSEMITELLDEEAMDEFDATLEYNTAIQWREDARFRLNVFKQRQHSGMVLRRVQTEIPSIDALNLPKPYADLAMARRGLVLIVGATGSGKSTSMAAMINQRNEQMAGHIVTVEDPIEFIHQHKKCIISQRDVGIDTYSYGIALKNVLRQRPDVIVIGEIRDRDTMEHALQFSETGHLCIATLHAGNTVQALERIVSMFPEDKHNQVWLSLSINLRGIFSQRLIGNKRDSRSLITEIMLNQGLIKNLVHDGKAKEIPEIISKSTDAGMITFDQHLMQLVESGEIDKDTAVDEADNIANIKLYLTKVDMNERIGNSGPIDKIATAMEKKSHF